MITQANCLAIMINEEINAYRSRTLSKSSEFHAFITAEAFANEVAGLC